MKKQAFQLLAILAGMPIFPAPQALGDVAPPASEKVGELVRPQSIIAFLQDELDYSIKNLVAEDGTKPYYIGYSVYDDQTSMISATLGAVVQDQVQRDRNLNIDLRVGSYELDNTRQLRGRGEGQASGSGNIALALDDNEHSIRHLLWYHTDKIFREAAKRYERIKTDLKVKVEEEDKSDDFSREEPKVHYEAPAEIEIDRPAWTGRLRKLSAIAGEYPRVYSSGVTLGVFAGTRFMVTNEGTRLQTAETRFRITMNASTKAEDGMDLSQHADFNAASIDGLPDDATLERTFREVLAQTVALREAPLAEPYIGPAILRNRASGVFFHEIFGHRMEGHRQKDVTEGQTFAKMLGEPVLPEFISVYSDPTLKHLAETDLRGSYKFDDEGVEASRVTLVDNGILQTFMMSRTPLERVPNSNAHGRRQPGQAPVGRQSNLIVESSKQVSFDELRGLLVEECKKQGKPYGLLFEDISGGFTMTTRRGPQSFKVLPLVVFRVFADGRPDELIRGVDIVGTPLTAFSKIIYTGDDMGVFNGSCGAESGWIPVSAASPSILVSTLEIEKRARDQSRPPILDPPGSVSQRPEPSLSGEGDVVIQAMADELSRAVNELKLEGLPRPYFVQLKNQDRGVYSLRATYGGLVHSQVQKNRIGQTRLRVGSHQLDNTNVPGSAGQIGLLPIDDNYRALRHGLWLLLDQDYKQSVEILSRKEAFLRAKTEDEDRADDFSPASPTIELEPIKRLDFSSAKWEPRIVELSDRFRRYPKIQNSNVSLVAGDSVVWLVNSEGTRLRTSDTGLMIEISAELQAPDGMPLSDSRSYLAETEDQLPDMDRIRADIDEMARNLIALSEAPILEQYTGPVLFETGASGAVFASLLADKLAARPVPVGARWTDDSLEKNIGLRVLPRSFVVYDDPGPKTFDGEVLAGAFTFDDEGVRAGRVELVEKGMLKTLVAGRAPTKKLKKSTGHGRSGGFGDARAQVGSLYISDQNAVTAAELKQELIMAAQDEGLPFGIRIETLSRGREGSLPSPAFAYKVFVEGDREELVRGMRFQPVQTRALRRLIAAGEERAVYNSLSPVGMSIIAPAIVFEELELTKVEREFDKLPILPSPTARKSDESSS